MKSYYKNLIAVANKKSMLMLMSNEIEDPSPFTKIIPAGEIIPGNDNLNIGLTKHAERRLALLEQASIEAHAVYLLAPWKMIGRHKRIKNISAKIELLSTQLITSREEDKHREEIKAQQKNVTILPVNPNAGLDAVDNSSDALVLDLREYEQQLTRLDNDTAAEHSLAVVDNG